MSNRAKLVMLYILSFIVSIAPLVIVVAINWSHYVSTPSRTVSLSIGGAMAVLLMLLKTLGKMPQNVNRVVKYGVLFGIVWLLEPIIQDLKILTFAAFIGELVDSLFFVWQIRRLKETILINRTAATTAAVTKVQIEEIINNAINGRV